MTKNQINSLITYTLNKFGFSMDDEKSLEIDEKKLRIELMNKNYFAL